MAVDAAEAAEAEALADPGPAVGLVAAGAGDPDAPARDAIVCVGLSHRTAPVALREQVALPTRSMRAAVRHLLAQAAVREVAVISTCNRTELYLCGEPLAVEHAGRAFLAGRARDGVALERALYTLRDDDAVAHLFDVAAGLEAIVLGEVQILGQVREAYRIAREEGGAGRLLHRLFERASEAGRRVHAETALGHGRASVGSVAADLARQVFDDLHGRSVLLVGAGEMSELTATHLAGLGATDVLVANRTAEGAARLARRFGGRTVAFEALGERLADVDIVICSTGASEPVIGPRAVERALARRRQRPLFLIDIAVPRDVDPAVNAVPGAFLYDIDDLQAVVDRTLATRREGAEAARLVLAEEVAAYRAWRAEADVVPALLSLRRRFEALRDSELDRAGLSGAEREAAERVTHGLLAKLLHTPTVRLKAAARGDAQAADADADALRRLFGL